MNDARTTSPLRRLHNSGPGPREVFNSPAIGARDHLDLVRALAWEGFSGRAHPMLPDALDDLDLQPFLDQSGESGIRLTPRIDRSLLVAFTRALLGHLDAGPDGTPAAEADADAWVGCLVRRVKTLGWQERRLALVRPQISPPWTWKAQLRSGTGPVTAREAALTLATYAVLAPPLLLWWRPPTLDWLRWDVSLELQWLAAEGGRP